MSSVVEFALNGCDELLVVVSLNELRDSELLLCDDFPSEESFLKIQ